VAIESKVGRGTAVIVELPGFVADQSTRELDVSHPRVAISGHQHSLS
jgi:hypothetical protein